MFCNDLERSFAYALHDFRHVQVVGETIAREKQCIAGAKLDSGAHLDAHVDAPDDVANHVPFFVVHGIRLIEKTGFDSVAYRRVRYGLHLDLPPLSGKQGQ